MHFRVSLVTFIGCVTVVMGTPNSNHMRRQSGEPCVVSLSAPETTFDIGPSLACENTLTCGGPTESGTVTGTNPQTGPLPVMAVLGVRNEIASYARHAEINCDVDLPVNSPAPDTEQARNNVLYYLVSVKECRL